MIFVESNYKNKTCYPPINLIFKAFKICSFDSSESGNSWARSLSWRKPS